MFGKLKNIAVNNMIQGAIEKITPIMNEHIERIKSLNPEQIYDDQTYDTLISKPAWTAISAKLGGLTQLYPAMDDKFILVMRHVRDEIVTVDQGRVDFIDDYQTKLSSVFMDGLQKEL